MSSISFYLMSFSHFLLSLPFSLFGLTNLGKDKFKADFQPPGYVFGIVWPILYLLFGIINLRINSLSNIDSIIKKKLLKESVKESLYQALWLLVSSSFNEKKYKIQYILSFFIILYLLYFAIYIRKNNLKDIDILSYHLYIPYCIWISFASLLSYQIFIKVIKN